MTKVMYWIDGSVDRKKCDNHMADFLIYEDKKRLVYDEYEQAIVNKDDPSWTTLGLAVTVYDFVDEDDYEEKSFGQSGYRLICPEFSIDNISKKRKDYTNFKYYLIHIENYLESKTDSKYKNIFHSPHEMYYDQQGRREYMRTVYMAEFIYYTYELQYLKEEFLQAGKESKEAMVKHILWDAISCLKHTSNHMPNPDAFYEIINTEGFNTDELELLVEKRNKYKLSN
jgi:hypothetical protein